MAIRCCNGCVAPKRYPGCQGHCTEYLAEKAKHDKEKAEADRVRHIKDGLTSQTLKGVNRAYKAQRGMKGK